MVSHEEYFNDGHYTQRYPSEDNGVYPVHVEKKE
jgi:hypothetical protein